MRIDDRLKAIWQSQIPDREDMQRITTAVRRHQRNRLALRALETALTLAAVGWFAQALLSRAMRPSEILLLPFLAIFLPFAWAAALQQRRLWSRALLETPAQYLRLRLLQVRLSLQHLRHATVSAHVLVGYSLTAWLAVRLIDARDWRPAADFLLAVALVWWCGTWLLSRHIGRKRRRELRHLLRTLRRQG